MADLAALARHQAAQARHKARSDGGAVNKGRDDRTAKGRLPGKLVVQVFRRLRDQAHSLFVTGMRRIGPADDAMPGQHCTLGPRIGAGEITDHHAKRKTGPLPGEPADLVTPDRPRGRLASAAGGQGDDRVRVDVVDMRERQQRVQRRIDAGRATVKVEGAMRKEADHFVVILRAGIMTFQRQQLVLIQRRKAIQLHRSDVAARSLDPQDFHRRAGQRVLLDDLGRRVAATEIGHGQVRTEQVGPIEQEFRFGLAQSNRSIPPAGRDLERDCLSRDWAMHVHDRDSIAKALFINNHFR